MNTLNQTRQRVLDSSRLLELVTLKIGRQTFHIFVLFQNAKTKANAQSLIYHAYTKIGLTF